MPHPLRKVANGLDVECVPIMLACDDVSGNTSKQWNIHYAMYMTYVGLPRTMIEKFTSTRFVCTSNHAGPLELFQGVTQILR